MHARQERRRRTEEEACGLWTGEEREESLIMGIVFSLWRQRQHHPVCVRGKSISSLYFLPAMSALPACPSSLLSFLFAAFDKLQIVFLVHLNM